MTLWPMLGVILAAGGVGGVVNALLTDNGFLLPNAEPIDGGRIIRPGVLGNILVGAVAAGISWGLYGPFAQTVILGPSEAAPQFSLTLSGLVGAILVGVAGARWLTNEVDKSLLKAATIKAAAARSPAAAGEIGAARPAEILRIVKGM